MAEGLGLKLHPEFSLTALRAPYARRLVLEEYSPVARARRLGKGVADVARFVEELPRDLRRLLRAIDQEGLPVRPHLWLRYVGSVRLGGLHGRQTRQGPAKEIVLVEGLGVEGLPLWL